MARAILAEFEQSIASLSPSSEAGSTGRPAQLEHELEPEEHTTVLQMVVAEEPKTATYKEEVLAESRKVELAHRISTWHAEAQRASSAAPPLHFEPSLTAGERKFVHAHCEARGSELSSKSEGKGKERHVVVYDAPVVVGTVGGVSAARRAELTARLESWNREQPLHFEATLTTAEREFVHQLAAQRKLSSKSEGKEYQGEDWHIVVRRGAAAAELADAPPPADGAAAGASGGVLLPCLAVSGWVGCCAMTALAAVLAAGWKARVFD
jgi:hypothetical protein